MKIDPTHNSSASSTRRIAARASDLVRAMGAFSGRHPVAAILLVSLVAVVINCYPVVFCGKSFVSPSEEMPMVYDWWPPLPGMEDSSPSPSFGSDTASVLIWGIPVGFIQSRSILEHGQLPLWNRHGHAGDTLIGQAISMLGDPLHLLVILGRGSAVAWDVKYLAAKFLFCAGFGLMVFRLLGGLQLALLFAAMAAWCGAFFYINIHPAFFVFAYSPWILLSAIRFLDVRDGGWMPWGFAWLIANCGCFNAGHVEASVLLIGGLNLTALVNALVNQRGARGSLAVFCRMAAGTLLFLGLTSPVWILFLAALDGAYTVHNTVRAVQLPFASLLGAFDDLFFRLPLKDDSYAAIAPGTSLLVAMGCGLSVMGWRRLKATPLFWINLVAISFWASSVFGVVPASLIELVPMVNRIGYIYRDFSHVLAFHLMLQCAFGFKALAQETSFKNAAMGLVGAGLMVAAIILLYFLGVQHRPVPAGYFISVIAGAFGAPLLFAFLKRGGRSITIAGWAGVIALGFLPHLRFGLYSVGDPGLVRIPGQRVVLNAPSDAVDHIRSDTGAAFRVVGVRRIFFGDYSAVYGLEDIRSCAPLSNPELIQLASEFPGMKFGDDWVIAVANPVTAQPLLNLFNVKYLLTPPGLVLQEGLDFRVAHRGDLAVLENLQVWPRAFFTDRVVSIASNDAFIRKLRSDGKHPFAAMTPEEISRNPGLELLLSDLKPMTVAATNFCLLPNSTSFDVHAATAGIICLSEGNARDFSVLVNNQSKPVLTVNRIFKGVHVEHAGDYHVEFLYRPPHWRAACMLFWISSGAIVCIAISIAITRKVRSQTSSPEPIPS